MKALFSRIMTRLTAVPPWTASRSVSVSSDLAQRSHLGSFKAVVGCDPDVQISNVSVIEEDCRLLLVNFYKNFAGASFLAS